MANKREDSATIESGKPAGGARRAKVSARRRPDAAKHSVILRSRAAALPEHGLRIVIPAIRLVFPENPTIEISMGNPPSRWTITRIFCAQDIDDLAKISNRCLRLAQGIDFEVLANGLQAAFFLADTIRQQENLKRPNEPMQVRAWFQQMEKRARNMLIALGYDGACDRARPTCSAVCSFLMDAFERMELEPRAQSRDFDYLDHPAIHPKEGALESFRAGGRQITMRRLASRRGRADSLYELSPIALTMIADAAAFGSSAVPRGRRIKDLFAWYFFAGITMLHERMFGRRPINRKSDGSRGGASVGWTRETLRLTARRLEPDEACRQPARVQYTRNLRAEVRSLAGASDSTLADYLASAPRWLDVICGTP